MAKLVLDSIASLQSESSAIATLNSNFQRIATAYENTFSRDGTAPNELTATIDFNSQRLTNLPAPASGSDAARLLDVQTSLSLTDTILPALSANKLLSNSGGALVWVAPGDIPGIGNVLSTNNLSELSNIATARTNLGLGTAAVATIGTSGDVVGKLNTNLTWSGANTHSGTLNITGTTTLGGSANHQLTTTPTTLTDTSLGYRGAPQNTQNGDYTFVLLDAGKHVFHASATNHAWTIPPNASVAYPVGTVILLVNFATSTLTLTRGAGVSLRIAGTSTDKNVSFGPFGVASLLYLGSNSWFVSGVGVT